MSKRRNARRTKPGPQLPSEASKNPFGETDTFLGISIDEALEFARVPPGSIKRKPSTFQMRACKVGETLKVIALSEMVFLETHWRFGRTIPHLILPYKCLCQSIPMQTRLKGYFLAMLANCGKPFLVEVTENAILGWSPEPDKESIAMRYVELKRVGPLRNGRVNMRVGECVPGSETWATPKVDVLRAVLEVILQQRFIKVTVGTQGDGAPGEKEARA